MPEEGKKCSPAQIKATKKYLHEKVEDIKIRVPKGDKEKIKTFAESRGKSLNQFIIDCITSEMGKD